MDADLELKAYEMTFGALIERCCKDFTPQEIRLAGDYLLRAAQTAAREYKERQCLVHS